MLLSGEEYSKRLEEFSDSTIQLIMDIGAISKELAIKRTMIVADPRYSEEEVVRLLTELRGTH